MIKHSFKCVLALVFAVAACATQAQDSHYSRFKGDPFFLLSDAAYGSADMPQVRLEVPGREIGRSAMEAYGGVDIVVYRVPEPLEFLKKQRNLHRIDVSGKFQGEGLANTLSYLWDRFWKQSRLAWRDLFSTRARKAVTTNQPALATDGKAMARPTEFRNNPQYKPLDGFEMVERFRYPIWQAKPIQPPKDVKLDGSSSEFIKVSPGNVMIPIGKRKPGLYLVEAMVGEHRATTLVFVSDTVAVTKVSSQQMLVWSSRRDTGAAVGDVNVVWTDGAGVLKSGKTGANGVALLERDSPEHTYVLGEDASGGVFVSENYYYDSEIYNTKIYAVTDRPLYRPGDEVNVKFMGREFKSARVSQAAGAGALQLTVLDPNGTPLLTQKLQLSGESGADTRFRLPPQANAGGYELRFVYQDTPYAAAFRVAEYVKPHFEITVSPAKKEFKTGEDVSGTIQLTYPDGKPVANAKLSLSARAQQNTMVEGELRYAGLFPVQLKTQEVETNGKGQADFTLPAAKEPSRYILTVLASDGAAYRVKTTRELMIERSASLYRIKGERQFSNPGEKVHFDVTPEGRVLARPKRWEMVQLEKQLKTQGAFDPAARGWDVTFPESGSWQLTLRDDAGNILGGTSHWVSGAGVKATPGSIEIVLDRERYNAGDTASVLMTFADPVDQALLTLERDKVESSGLLTDGAGWIKPVRVAPNQWRATIPVRAEYGPNMTFSVAYVKKGDFVFQNAGLQIAQPQIALQFRTDKEVYQPGETVTLDVTSTLAGQPVSALVALGVVDEMIYVLQPEIAPDINDFFYHPRRNNVRTTASLQFISYDLAQGRSGGAPARHNYNERGVKVLERPRRDDIDTAYWNGSLRTDAKGSLRVQFRVPDALTRWRITGRAMDSQGVVGQRSAWLRSDKQFYSKWTAPNWMRAGDAPIASLAVFNQTQAAQDVDVTLTSGGTARTAKLSAKPGVNYVQFPLAAASTMRLEVKAGGKLLDALDTQIRSQLTAWRSPRSLTMPLAGAATPLALPADARNVRVSFASSAGAHFARIADDLIDFPYGCVEQTSSRLIPLSLGVQNIGPGADAVRERLLGTLQSQRLRLVAMAGPQAVFGWWGDATEGSAMMTAYAYYADWYAARALNLNMPDEHWENLLTVYQKLGPNEPPLQRAIILWMAQEMGLPVATLASGLGDTLAKSAAPVKRAAMPVSQSAVLSGAADDNMTLALFSLVAKQSNVEIAPALQARIEQAWTALREQPLPMAQALLMLGAKLPPTEAETVLSKVRSDMATFDRALTLVWVQKALGGAPGASAPSLALDGGWRSTASNLGQALWRWPEGTALPGALQVSQAIPARTVAVVQYDSFAPEVQSLPVQVERRILRMKQKKDGFDLQEMKADEALRTDELYLDEIVLRPAAAATHRYGLLEVALPPGASVEAGTWGIKVPGKENYEPLERARHEERRDGYVVPIDPLSGEVKVRHLLRFAQKGSYKLPPARFYRMYQPDQKAFEAANKQVRLMKVE